jgi:hypothetical protein
LLRGGALVAFDVPALHFDLDRFLEDGEVALVGRPVDRTSVANL